MADDQAVFGDRYHLVRHVARGGMAQVYLARDALLDRDVALKVLFPELSVDEAFVERFRREAQAAARLAHPNIVSIYDWGQGDRTYYIVMEYVDGETLSARIRRGAMPPDQAAIVGIATSSALAFAHRRQVIHRDVKPGNVLIDRLGQVKVADFGIAQAVGTAENLTQAGAVMGTATYFSPEQAQGLAVDARSDVYSLGVVLYEMAAGRPPFAGDTPVAIAYQHVRETAPPLRSVNPAIPAPYEAVVAKAMAKDPADRYQTADDLRADLERFRAGQPVMAAARGGATAVMAGVPAAAATRAQRAVAPTTVSRAPETTYAAAEEETRAVPVEPPPPSRRGWWLVLALVLLALLGVLGYFVARDLGAFGSSVAVPSVAGEPESQAVGRLRAAGLLVNPQTVTNPSVPKGDVVGTQPPGGQRVASGSTITLLVSAGPGSVTVPNVAGQSQAAATSALVIDGFRVKPVSQASTSVHPGTVIGTSPPNGDTLPKGSLVTLLVSSGPQKVAIPGLTGETPSAAGAKLTQLGLNVASQQSEPSTSVQAGEVTRTSPGAGAQVDVGTSVTIYVSSGPPQVTVPSVLGDTRDAAAAALSNVGLQASFAYVSVDSPSQNGLVQAQNPTGGATLPTGGTVTVDLGTYTAPSTTAPSTTTTTTTGSSTTSSSTSTSTTSSTTTRTSSST